MKQFKFGKDARDALFRGIEVLARSVTTTLGPKGRNVALDKKWNTPSILHDGVSVAKDVELPDPFENIGAQLVKEAASKTNDKAGDGTTTSTLLAYEIVKEGNKALDGKKKFWFTDWRLVGVKREGINPMSLKKGIDIAIETVVEELKKISQPVSTHQRIAEIATISSANPQIGKMIADAMDKVGRDGVITVDRGTGMTTDIEYKEGMEFDGGAVSPYLYTDSEKEEAELNNPFILMTDQHLDNPSELLGLFEKIVKEGKSKELVILADGFGESVIGTLVVNKVRGTFTGVAAKAPSFGDRRKQVLGDIAALVGGAVITKESGITLENVGLEHLGRCERVWADKEKVRIIGGLGDRPALESRITQIKNELKKEKNSFEQSKLKERLSKLTGGAAIIKVGAQTEIELEEIKERVNDAVEATKSAVAEGYVVGGGLALRNCAYRLIDEESFVPEGVEPEISLAIQTGVQIVYEILSSPFKKILSNAGYNGEKISGEMMLKTDIGIDVETGKKVDLIKAGIIDPTKVVRSALQNAGSVAGMILTTDCIVAYIPESEKKTDD